MKARLFDTTAEALADTTFVMATYGETARFDQACV
jgi:tRNA C32,U32 (ribose-2'-O)-methylase TrmJ